MALGTRTRSPEALLGDIAQWGERLATHIAGMTREAFLQDIRTQDAVCKCVEVLGEAARGLMLADPGMEARHPDLALRLAYATRNQLSHGYGRINYDVLWATAHDAVPKMVAAACALLQSGL